jgi:hypothetical protein
MAVDVRHQQGGAIDVLPGHMVSGNHARCASFVLNDHIHIPHGLQLDRHHTGQGIGAARDTPQVWFEPCTSWRNLRKPRQISHLGPMTCPEGGQPKKVHSAYIFANSRRSMKAIVLHMAFAMGGGGVASARHQRCTFAPHSPLKPQTSA